MRVIDTHMWHSQRVFVAPSLSQPPLSVMTEPDMTAQWHGSNLPYTELRPLLTCSYTYPHPAPHLFIFVYAFQQREASTLFLCGVFQLGVLTGQQQWEFRGSYFFFLDGKLWACLCEQGDLGFCGVVIC